MCPVPRVLAAAALLAGCSSADPSTSEEPGPPTYGDVADRCGAGDSGELITLGSGLGRRPGAVFGEGAEHAAVLLHQDEVGGLCGWVPYAVQAAGQGVMSVLVDLCGYGPEPDCDGELNDDAAAVRLAVGWAREHGATTVTLTGASLGATLAAALGHEVGADAVAAVSPPSQARGESVAGGLAETTEPALVIASRNDEVVSLPALRDAVARSPSSDAVFLLSATSGHGYRLLFTGSGDDARLTDNGEQLLRWLQGTYPDRT